MGKVGRSSVSFNARLAIQKPSLSAKISIRLRYSLETGKVKRVTDQAGELKNRFRLGLCIALGVAGAGR